MSNLHRYHDARAMSSGRTTLDAAGAQGYTVNFMNNSTNAGSVYMFQTNPGANVQNVSSLAWFSYGSNPGTSDTFQWSIDYAMLWSSVADLIPGVVVTTSQTLPCSLSSSNQATFTHNEFGFLLNELTTSTTAGITIIEDGTIPASMASIGIAMSGAGVFAVEAQPNLSANFDPTPTYWISFDLQPIQQGAVLISQGTSAQQITFGDNIFNCNVTLNQNNTWTITYS